MALKYMQEYRDSDICRHLVQQIHQISQHPIRLMEVCGTHTMAIFKSGLRTLLPETITLLSGPGCPVCVTAQDEIDAFVALSRKKEIILTTFGDLMRVPGSGSSLQKESAMGADVRMVYSTMDALTIAKENPDRQVVFLAVGFETTAPTVAAAILMAKQMAISNFSIYCAHKLVPPALFALMNQKQVQIDGLLLPGHVSAIIGCDAYQSFFDCYKLPCVVGGFEASDLLQAIVMLVTQIENRTPALENAYTRVVCRKGNPKARTVMATVFDIIDATWRGIGPIAQSGLCLKKEFKDYDARTRFNISITTTLEPAGCQCGEILSGIKIPPQCPLFQTVCTPVNPVGPCMVSSEGTCAAYYRYHN
ncbi:MAG: hydrogenase formation protein HypD [Desulfobacteraceae bacterium]|jgi:hydrogenase expression/formation protein HypD